MTYTPPAVADHVDDALEQFGGLLEKAQLLLIRVHYWHGKNACTGLFSFNPYEPLWQDKVRELFQRIGQNRIISFTCHAINNPEETDAEPS